MAWCECECGHHRADHQRIHWQYGGCGHCTLCDKPSREHVFVTHQFSRCECSEYQETA